MGYLEDLRKEKQERINPTIIIREKTPYEKAKERGETIFRSTGVSEAMDLIAERLRSGFYSVYKHSFVDDLDESYQITLSWDNNTSAPRDKQTMSNSSVSVEVMRSGDFIISGKEKIVITRDELEIDSNAVTNALGEVMKNPEVNTWIANVPKGDPRDIGGYGGSY